MDYSGKTVRLKGDVSKRGVCTTKTISRGSRLMVQVQFPDGIRYIPEDQIELIIDSYEHPLDLFRAQKFGHHKDLRNSLIHVRLNGRLVDLIYSMEVTNTEFYPFQFKPVLKILNSVSNGILIADEVGLGKTIEAGLIWTELKSRFDFRKLLVLCPAVLRDKWKWELHHKFGIEADILNAKETLQILKETSTNRRYKEFSIICSMQGLRATTSTNGRKSAASQLAEFLYEYEHDDPLIDCLVIDEAHYLRNPYSKTSKLGFNLRNVAAYAVLLSATPIHLKSDDLFQLLHLLDEDTFNHPSSFDEILNANKPLIELRNLMLEKDVTTERFQNKLAEALSHPLLKENRQLKSFIDNPPTASELADMERKSYLAYRFENLNILGHVVTRTRKREVQEGRVKRNPVAEKIPMTRVEERFYNTITKAVRKFCKKANYFEGFMLVTPQRMVSSSMPAALYSWKKRRDAILQETGYEDIGYVLEQNEEIGPLTKELLNKVEYFGDFKELYSNDSKYKTLVEKLKTSDLKEDKIVLFSYFRPTIEYLYERLKTDGFSAVKLMGGSEYDKSDIIKKFKTSTAKILLSTEVGSEGIDLQFCRIIINYDLPWNPMKIEQRIGRIDRLGQKAKRVTIWNLFYDNTIDSRIYERLLLRLDIFKRALGGLEPIIGEKIQKLTMQLLSKDLTPEEEEEQIEQTRLAIENIKLYEEKLEQEAAHLVAYGDYILNKIKAARHINRWISGHDLKNYVLDYMKMNYQGCEFLQIRNDEMRYKIKLSDRAKEDLENYIKNNRIATSTLLTRANPQAIDCLFDNKLFGTEDRRIEIINQIHPLIRFIGNCISKEENTYHPAVAIKLHSNEFENGLYAFSVQKWTIEGLQDMEKLYYAAMLIEPYEHFLSQDQAEKLVIDTMVKGEDWFEVKAYIDTDQILDYINERCLQTSDNEFDRFKKEMEDENADRVDIQLKTLDKHLRNQLEIKKSVRQRHIEEGRDSLIKATEGQIRALKNRVNRRKMAIEDKRNVRVDKNEICLGVIKVY